MSAENGSIVGQAVALCEGMLEKTGIDRYLGHVGLSLSRLAHGLVFFATAFGVGFCFKRYFKIVFGAILFTTLAYLVLHYNNLITVDWVGLKDVLGVPLQQAGVNNILGTFWVWIKSHIFLSIVTSLGFLLGYKMG